MSARRVVEMTIQDLDRVSREFSGVDYMTEESMPTAVADRGVLNLIRLRMSADMFEASREIVLAGLTAEGPVGVRERLFIRFYGADFGPRDRARIVEEIRRRESPQPWSLSREVLLDPVHATDRFRVEAIHLF